MIMDNNKPYDNPYLPIEDNAQNEGGNPDNSAASKDPDKTDDQNDPKQSSETSDQKQADQNDKKNEESKKEKNTEKASDTQSDTDKDNNNKPSESVDPYPKEQIIETPTAKFFTLLEDRIRLAKRTIKRAPHLKGDGDPLYRVPWFVILGDEASKTANFMKAGNIHAPIPPLLNEPFEEQGNWCWWFFKSFVGVEVKTEKMGNPSNINQWEIWRKAVTLLRRQRSRVPVNGCLVCISAKTLNGSPDYIRDIGRQYRAMIDEMYKDFEMRFPVYVIVTELDKVKGFHSFFQALPEGVGDQVFGHRLDIQTLEKRNVLETVNDVYDNFTSRLHSIRLDLLKTPRLQKDRHGIFNFVESLKVKKKNLKVLCDVLFSENPYQYEPFWRSLYFVAPQSDIKLMRDLFSRFLPVDQGLARKR